ncbi:hypothetical protein MMC14_005179 [Varicellaria rhodocarpa]|nr:hypothetical protein [Varicellaria rhodocarpa]
MSFTPRSATEFPCEGYDIGVATLGVEIRSDTMKHAIKVSIPLFKFNGDESLTPSTRRGSPVARKGRVQISFLADVEVEICVDDVRFGYGRALMFDIRGYQETTGYGPTYSEAVVGGAEDSDTAAAAAASLDDEETDEETGTGLQDQEVSGSGLGDEEKPEFGFENSRLPQEGFSVTVLHLLELHPEV